MLSSQRKSRLQSTGKRRRSNKIGFPSGTDIRFNLQNPHISKTARKLIMQSWRKPTRQQYRTFLRRWEIYCEKKRKNSLDTNIGTILDFLVHLHKSGIGYSSLNTARSALSTILHIDGFPAGNHPLTCRLMKGFFNKRPTFPRYTSIWDANSVLNSLAKLHPPNTLSLKQLTLKTVLLSAILSGQRVQSLKFLHLNHMLMDATCIQFTILNLLKTSKPGRHLEPLIFLAFKDKSLCIVHYIKEYIKRTQSLRHDKQLFISYRKPHNAVSKSTIATWIRTELQVCGVDIRIFKAHSTRSASASAANKLAPLTTIMKSAGWRSESTFTKFYKKPILADKNFARVLQNTAKGGGGGELA